MRIVNLAQGSLYLLGGYVGLSVIRGTGSFWLALPAAGLAMGVLGLVVERGLLRTVRGRPMSEILLTVGLSFIAADLGLAVWGGDPITLDVPGTLDGRTALLGVAGYALAILATRHSWPLGAAILGALALSVLAAAFFGLLLVRARGTYFVMI